MNDKYKLLLELNKIKKNKNGVYRQAKTFVSKIEDLVSELIQNNIKDITKVKEYLGNKNIDEKNKRILYTIFNCRQNGEKILLNTNCFNKYIHLYLYGENIKTKCITNDYLYLTMISNALINKKALNHVLYDTAELENVSIISDNFKLDEEGYSGFIQDYDPNFSIICVPGFDKKKVGELINSREGENKFAIGEKEYEYFGNADSCFIVPIDSPNEEILQRYNMMKYLSNNNSKFKVGLKTVRNNDKLHFLDKTMNQEKFCPSFWASNIEIKLKFLFDYKLDYNTLFTYIQSQGIKAIPENFCYWTTIPQCFDFLSVLSVTGVLLDDDSRFKISRWCDNYNYYKFEVGELKGIQLLLQRIYNDFLNCFINNSEYTRFVSLYGKIDKYCSERDRILKYKDIKDVIKFFTNLPFTTMITNQLRDENFFTLPNRVKSCIGNYLNGANPDGIMNDIRDIAKRIQMLLPQEDMRNCAFPFIVAGGPLLGEGFVYNSNKDPLLTLTIANYTRKKKEQQKQKETFAKVLEEYENIEDNMDKMLRLYIKKFMADQKYKKNYDMEMFISDIKKQIKRNNIMKEEILKAVYKFKRNNRSIPALGTLRQIDRFLSNYIEDEIRERGQKVKKGQEIPEDVYMDIEPEEDVKSEPIPEKTKKRRGKFSLD